MRLAVPFSSPKREDDEHEHDGRAPAAAPPESGIGPVARMAALRRLANPVVVVIPPIGHRSKSAPIAKPAHVLFSDRMVTGASSATPR